MVEQRRRCSAITSGGKPCPIAPPAGRSYCLNHDPERTEEAAAARKRGGIGKARDVRIRKLAQKSLQTMGDVRDVILLAILEARDGTISPKVAQAMSSLAKTADALTITESLERQIADQNRRIAQLEEVLNVRDAERRAG
jgi:hypothetical protein